MSQAIESSPASPTTNDFSSDTVRRPIAALLAILAWAGVAAQAIGLQVIARKHGWTTGQWLNGFFAYFTNLTNVLIAILLTRHALQSKMNPTRMATSLDAATVVYIAIVGIVNAIMLRGVWHPHGWFLLGDILCHTILPIGYPLYWLALVRKTKLPWGDALRWLAYPALFGIISVARGLRIGWYPYPFFNIEKLGGQTVSLILGILGSAIVLLGAIVIAVDRAMCQQASGDRDE